MLILNSSPKIGEVPVRAEVYDITLKALHHGVSAPLTPSSLRGGVANALIDS